MFRPFAPTVLRASVSTYFEQDVFSPFMMHVVKIRPEWRDRLPAVTHVDGTGRLQSIERETNPLYYDLIEAFSKLSGVAILLNTSFNENEPIVDTPQQALACFLRTGLDALCIGREILVKPEFGSTLDDMIARSGEPLLPTR
jgi:carbamoyltransferase